MRSVLISIHPKWCEKIANGEKTIEVRKSAPEEVPFKAYIYCTNTPKYHHLYDLRYLDKNNSKIKLGCVQHNKYSLVADGYMNGKVIGEFICDKVERLEEHIEEGGLYYTLKSDFNEATQLDNWELHDYGKGKTLYCWRISDLKIYDKPKELSEFFAKCRFSDKKCRLCDNCFEREDSYGRYYAVKKLTRPPQSWCYVEGIKNV